MVEKEPLSSLTYARTQALSPCFVGTLFTYKAMAIPNVYVVSWNPIIMWQKSHLLFKKWMIKTNVSTPFIDIQRSKDMVHVLHD
jgi:hypothetical protein